jgi:hypothetical protein
MDGFPCECYYCTYFILASIKSLYLLHCSSCLISIFINRRLFAHYKGNDYVFELDEALQTLYCVG